MNHYQTTSFAKLLEQIPPNAKIGSSVKIRLPDAWTSDDLDRHSRYAEEALGQLPILTLEDVTRSYNEEALHRIVKDMASANLFCAGFMPKPPTRWQRICRPFVEMRRRIRNAWRALGGAEIGS